MTAVNPGHLKLELALQGVCLDPGLVSSPAPRAVELLLPEEVIAFAPVLHVETVADRPAALRLQRDGDRFQLLRGGERIEVRLNQTPAFYSASTRIGTPMRQIGSVFGSFIALSPLGGCGFSLHGGPCPLCAGENDECRTPTSPPEPADVVDTVRAAFAEGAVEFVLFNAGATETESEDGGMAALEPYVRAVKRHFDTFVAIQIHPPASHRWIDRTYATGVDAVSYSLEAHDPAELARLCPGRVSRIGRQRYEDALAHAASIFPSGTVWSELLAGAEPPDSTMRGIDELTRMGVLPVLSFSHPDACARSPKPPRAEEMLPVLAYLFQAVRQAKINMGWVHDLSFAITPFEARYFGDEDARLSVAQQFYRSRLGGLAARNLARLRRRLRVRTVSDSFDSSHL
jgi:hypothetical protein